MYTDAEGKYPALFENLRAADYFMELQKGILCSDAFLVHKRPEIAGYFALEQDTVLQTEYFKNCFHIGMTYVLGVGDSIVEFHAEENGIYVRDRTKDIPSEEVLLSWEDARYWVNAYMEDGVYLLPGEKAEQIDTDGIYQQLNLFTTFSEQVGNIVVKQAEEKNDVLPVTAIPRDQITEILRSGGGKDNNRKRIYARYRQGKTPEEMAAFLKKEYGTTGKGFEFDGKQIAVWFNESGMTAGYGTSALESPAVTMSWQEIEAEIRLQVENGTYMGKNEAYLVDETERGRIAHNVYFFFRDGIGEFPEELKDGFGKHPKSPEKLIEMLSDRNGLDVIAKCVDRTVKALETGKIRLRIRFIYTPEELLGEIVDLQRDKTDYPVQDSIEIKKEDFITQDEIDHRLGRGSNYEHGSFRIYEYFMEEHNSKDAADFLKKEYGTGGSSHALAGADHSFENHDSKGIMLEKGEIGSPYTKVLL
ncbi:MAG: helicase SNF2, partial [Lachnospiraceae bacterium]|nr:helicase SNF2 [Lachnospiraceae bacterium]